MKNRRLSRISEAGGIVIIHGPAAVGDQICKTSARAHIVLRQDVIPHIPPAFPFAGQEAHPV